MVLNESVGLFTNFVGNIGQIGLALQTLGIVVILAIVFQFIGFFLNRKRLQEIHIIKQDMARIERKIDRILHSVTKK